MSKKQFKAESKRLLDLMINSIYTHKEIFLREIISNASDAIDKLCYLSLTDDKVGMNREDFRILVTADEAARTITVSDNGIGMTKEELEQNLGVIAKSGSMAFKDGLGGEENQGADVDIIGQFGVGFYSAFMVSDRVTVISKAYGADTAYRWESEGADGYTIDECEKDTVGTDVIMHIKPDDESERYGDFLQQWKLMQLIKKYSNYIRWPIQMDVKKSDFKETGEKNEDGSPKYETVTTTERETVNSMVPIWQRSKSEVSDEDCVAFYKEKFHDTTDPAAVIRVNAEGQVSYKALLFIPGRQLLDYMASDFEPGLQLYSSGVMIMERCPDLLSESFYFVRGIVDSPDLSLNISREMLQHDRQLRIIAQNLNKRIKNELVKMLESDREKYEKFYKNYGRQLRYGAVANYGQNVQSLSELLLYYVDVDKTRTLKEYTDAMPAEQEKIYYAVGDSVARTLHLPQAELVRSKGYELLCMTDEVDEFIIQQLGTYAEKPFCNIVTDDLGLESEEERADIEKRESDAKETLDFVRETLGERVAKVKLSHKLVSAPVCLTTEGGVTLEMERYFRSMPDTGMQPPKATRVLELNADSPAFAALESAVKADPERARKLVEILHAQALLIAGEELPDPAQYAEDVCSLF
ncbi:MAG TPA: molecular chaperone HtpG [Candidatus Scatomorpha stercorigallinarum]|nr:molecular chaperone HtpG [Candidatus Scatomorpha stercorigallinarum]